MLVAEAPPRAVSMSRAMLRAPSRLPHRLAVVLVWATAVLLWVGGLVTSYDAGMAVHDWPTTFGYNMFLFPWPTWLLGPWDVFIEHGHRLLATVVGMLTIALVLAVGWSDRRKWLLVTALGALALVCTQGILGGMRVVLGERTLAQLHGAVGPLFFATAVALASFTSRWWAAAGSRPAAGSAPQAAGLKRLVVTTLLLAYVQLILGGFVRHVPDSATPAMFRMVVVFHLVMAVALVGSILLLGWKVLRNFRSERLLRRPAFALVGLVLVQLGLGAGAWIMHYGMPAWFANEAWAAEYTVIAKSPWQIHVSTAHVVVGSLILVTALSLALRAMRLLRSAGSAGASPSLADRNGSGAAQPATGGLA
jgi:cytochrome c oxidase assembly protein subunit 15